MLPSNIDRRDRKFLNLFLSCHPKNETAPRHPKKPAFLIIPVVLSRVWREAFVARRRCHGEELRVGVRVGVLDRAASARWHVCFVEAPENLAGSLSHQFLPLVTRGVQKMQLLFGQVLPESVPKRLWCRSKPRLCVLDILRHIQNVHQALSQVRGVELQLLPRLCIFKTPLHGAKP